VKRIEYVEKIGMKTSNTYLTLMHLYQIIDIHI